MKINQFSTLSCMTVFSLALMSCGEKVKVESYANSGVYVSGSADINISTTKEGSDTECQHIYKLATNASSDAQMLGLFLSNSDRNPQIERKLTEIKQDLDQLQSATINDPSIISLRSEYVSIMQMALQPVEAWSASKAETQRQQITETFSTHMKSG
ncbi:hypothetical protein JOY44_14660 [Phormidium sp. CLA17]|uniref:hypothetical protein n=1 Tax=Leptolyngbya sp. Cla-17 TaxID=2803751 RepID=UPI001490910B|nr:hypothetical protein [Leptolyngbya sp. Cla-17]MBM0742835.1 hypothetical protein [Leptolyngbya sp. Cla-17]